MCMDHRFNDNLDRINDDLKSDLYVLCLEELAFLAAVALMQH